MKKTSAENQAGAPEAKTAKKPAARKAHTPPPEVYLEVNGGSYNCAEILERARNDYRLTHKTGIHSSKIYIKPEENAVYYVINKVEGKIPLDLTDNG